MALEANVGVSEELFVEMVDGDVVKIPRELFDRLVAALKERDSEFGKFSADQMRDIVVELEKL